MRLSTIIIILLAFCFVGCAKKLTYTQLENRFGKLEPYQPRTSFVHFKTKDGKGIDCIFDTKDSTYQFLSGPYTLILYYTTNHQ